MRRHRMSAERTRSTLIRVIFFRSSRGLWVAAVREPALS
jgi:hypothetical protein